MQSQRGRANANAKAKASDSYERLGMTVMQLSAFFLCMTIVQPSAHGPSKQVAYSACIVNG